MAKLGRRKANLISIAIVISGWVCIIAAQNITWLLVARLLQGLSAGMSSCLTPILIGEYTSPKNRGAFTIVMSLIMATATLTVHTLGSYFTWKLIALVITIVSLIDLLLVALTPEAPSWLADQGRYEECEKVFRWLRGDDEIEELHKLIQASIVARQSTVSSTSSSRVKTYISTVKKKEFYKPIIIMIHLYTMGQWGGINLLAPYIVDMVHHSVGSEFNTALIVITVDVQRVMSCVLAVFIIRRIKRRTMLFTACGLNALVFLVTAGYLYAKTTGALSCDHPVIGILLIHALMMTVAIGSLPLPYTIAGEIFALRYKSLSSGFSSLFCSINIFLPTKTFSYLVKSIGLHGAYFLYACIMLYCLIVVWYILPETKDRTLQDIEDEFKGKVVDEDLNAAEPLTRLKGVGVEE